MARGRTQKTAAQTVSLCEVQASLPHRSQQASSPDLVCVLGRAVSSGALSGCVYPELVPHMAHVECRMGSPGGDYKGPIYSYTGLGRGQHSGT